LVRWLGMELASCDHVTLRIWRWLLGFLKICAPAIYLLHVNDISDTLVPLYWTKVHGVKLQKESPSATPAAASNDTVLIMKFV
jgi:hypothetical protein